MKKGLRLGLIFVALSLSLGSVVISVAQQQRAPIIVGGYKKIATNDAEASSAARFAVSEVGRRVGSTVKLISIERAERQTVQGANYKLCLKVEIEDETNNVDVTQDIRVIVYSNLKRQYSLSKWEEADCSDGQ